MDVHNKKTRSFNMSRIRSSDTKPELAVRWYLFRNGFRYFKNVRSLPATPDIVLPKYRVCIFVNGCFWHRHEGCKYSKIPSTNIEFWSKKIGGNVDRDRFVNQMLKEIGWRVVIIWECELNKNRINSTLSQLHKSLNHPDK